MDNNNENNSLFEMYGTEDKEKQENHSTIDKLVTFTEEEPKEQEEVVKEEDVKPVPDEILEEANKKIEDRKETPDELLKIYIGPNAESIMKGGFSFHTLFLGMYYLSYRKQHQYVKILLLMQIGLIVSYSFQWQLPYSILSIGILIINFYLAITFKQKYLEQAKFTIDQIQSEGGDLETQKNKIAQAGGVNHGFWLLIILMFVISSAVITFSTKILSKRYDRDVLIEYPEEFNFFLNEAVSNGNSYDIGDYHYDDIVFYYREKEDVCKYHFYANNEYNAKGKDKLEVVKKYMDEKHSITAEPVLKAIEGKDYYYYHNETEKDDSYVLVTDKSITEINVVYIQDKSKVCHKYTDYIVEHIEVKK